MWKITIANFAVDPASDLALSRGENIFDPRKQIKTNKKKGTLRNRKHADSDSVVIEFMREVEKDFQQSRLKAEDEDDTDPPKVFISLVKRSDNDESSAASHPGSRVRDHGPAPPPRGREALAAEDQGRGHPDRGLRGREAVSQLRPPCVQCHRHVQTHSRPARS